MQQVINSPNDRKGLCPLVIKGYFLLAEKQVFAVYMLDLKVA